MSLENNDQVKIVPYEELSQEEREYWDPKIKMLDAISNRLDLMEKTIDDIGFNISSLRESVETLKCSDRIESAPSQS